MPDVFQIVAGDFRIAPQEAADVGDQPEPVDPEREHEKQRAADQEPEEGPLAAMEARNAGILRQSLGRRGRNGGYSCRMGSVDRGH